jgi:predicted Zn-dependent peptidase
MKRQLKTASAVLLAVAVLGLFAAAFAKEAPPAPDKIKKLTFPGYKEFALKNGMELLVVEHHEQPMVSLYFVFKTGSALDPKGKESLASFTIDQLNKGTKTRTALQLAEWIESVGGSVGAFSASDYSAITVSILSEYIDVAYQYLQDVVMNPVFPEDELETIRERTKTALELELSQPSAMAQRHFDEIVYGDHPYGKKPTAETVKSITRDDMVDFYKKNCVANNILVSAVGDVKAGDVKKAVEKYFGAMQPGTPGQSVYTDPSRLEKTKIFLYHRPGAVQTEIYIGHLGVKADNPDWPALRVGNRVLGGGSDARLFMNIREDKGWTYGAYSSFSKERDYGYFQAYAAVRTEVTDSALTEFMKEIKRIQTEPVSDADLTNAKNYLVGNFPLQIETPDQIAQQIVEAKMLGLGKQYLETYRDRTAAVTVADVSAAMGKYVDSGKCAIVLVGDALSIKDKVEPFGEVALFDIAGAPLSYAALAVTPVDYQYDTSKLGGFKGTYALNVQTMAIGDMNVTIDRKKDQGGEETIQVVTSLSGMVSLNEEMAFRAADLSPVSYKRTMQVGPRSMGAELAFDGAKCTGKVTSMESGEPKDISVDLVKGTILDASIEYAVSSLPLAVKTTYRFPVVDTQSGSLGNIDVEVLEEVEVKTPAGSFMTYKLKVKRAEGESILYLGKDAPHFMVKQEVPSQQMIIELKSKSK